MTNMHGFFTDVVRIGKKGQITIPKAIRDEDDLQEDDAFIVTHTTSGAIILQKQKTMKPEDLMLEAVQRSPKIDWKRAWKEARDERRRERS